MSTIKNYTTKTAALKATVADISKLKVKGKDVATSVKHPNDTREVITENDLWGSWAEITKDGEIIFHDDEVTNPNASNWSAWNSNIAKVEDNKAYTGEIDYYGDLTNLALYANIQTEKIKNGRYMFYNCSALKTFTSDLSSLTNGYSMFYNCSALTAFTGDSDGSPVNLSSLTNGNCMFMNCPNLTSFTSDLSSLDDGQQMFYQCENLTNFASDLSSLTSGYEMFYQCKNLKTFNSDLSSLTDGWNMFNNCSKLTNFTSDLSSLTDGWNMFYGCSYLTTFTSDLSSLTDGSQMFYNCSKLTNFASDLSSLTSGYNMFYGCQLDTESIMHIAETIKTESNKTIHIGIGNTTPTAEETELLTEIHNKGWKVYVNGWTSDNIFTPTATTPIDGEEVTTPIPYWAKPQETDEEHAEYVGEDGKFYIILGGNYIFVDDPETYGLFTSLEDAAANMRLTKIERN